MSDESAPKPYHVEVAVAVSRDLAWDAVTQPAVVRQWFGWDYEGLDAEIEQIFVTEARLISPARMGWADGSYLEVTGDDERSAVHAVLEGPPGPDGYDPMAEGWRAFLTQLKFLLERRPAGPRRTLYLTGESTGSQVLGLSGGDWTRQGPRSAWTVDGDVLVVASTRVPLDDRDAARAEVTVSTYGLDDAAFGRVREEWTSRWAPVAAGAEVTVA